MRAGRCIFLRLSCITHRAERDVWLFKTPVSHFFTYLCMKVDVTTAVHVACTLKRGYLSSSCMVRDAAT